MARWVRQWVFFGSILCATGASHGQVPEVGSAHRLCWQPGRRLMWSDFRAKTYPRSGPFTGEKTAAISAVAPFLTPIVEKGVPSYRVDCVFLRDSSWINNQAVKTAIARAETLIHEQIHFDIAELTTRKLRLRIADGLHAGQNIYGPEVSLAINRLRDEEDALDEEFDQETATSSRDQAGGVYRRWQRRIAQELAVLAAYKSTAATCP